MASKIENEAVRKAAARQRQRAAEMRLANQRESRLKAFSQMPKPKGDK